MQPAELTGVRAWRAAPRREHVVAADRRASDPVLHTQGQRGTRNRGIRGNAEITEANQVFDDVAVSIRGLVVAQLSAGEVGEPVARSKLGVLRGDAGVSRPGIAINALLQRDGGGLIAGIVVGNG